MFNYESKPFGRFTQHQLQDESGQSAMAVAVDGSACLLRLRLGGQEVLDGYEMPESLASNSWFKNVPLFPFPNRLADGAFEWQGETLHFSINDWATGNALHGMSREFAAELVELQHEGDQAVITCRYHCNGEFRSYPFPFTFQTSYRLENANQFEGLLEFRNDGNQAIPVALGWHPYFRLSNTINELKLQLPPCQMVGIDERMLPTGKRYDYEEFAELRPLGSTVLDNCFALQDTGKGRAEIHLAGAAGRLRLWQETGPNKFNYFQVFTHPDRVSIAIEPMTANVDAFHNREGLTVLQAGETLSARFGAIWEPNA